MTARLDCTTLDLPSEAETGSEFQDAWEKAPERTSNDSSPSDDRQTGAHELSPEAGDKTEFVFDDVPRARPQTVDSGTHSSIPDLGLEAERIVRTHFADQILEGLTRIQRFAGQPAAAADAGSILSTIRSMRDISPADPYLAVALALHDALAVDNKWASYSSAQYKEAHTALKGLATADCRENAVDKAISRLAEVGFDVSPFGVDDSDAAWDDSEGDVDHD